MYVTFQKKLIRKKKKKAQISHWCNEGKNTNHILGCKKEKRWMGMYRNKKQKLLELFS